MKFTQHTKLYLDDTCVVLWNNNDVQVSSLSSKNFNNEKYFLLESDKNIIKKFIGDNYKLGDAMYLKDGQKNEIIKEDNDHWRAVTPVYIFNDDGSKYQHQRTNLLHIRCW